MNGMDNIVNNTKQMHEGNGQSTRTDGFNARRTMAFLLLAALAVTFLPGGPFNPRAAQASMAFAVTYLPNGGTGAIVSHSVTDSTYHSVDGQGYMKNGYSFAGWNTEADGTGASFATGDFLYVAEDIFLFAQWEPPTESTAASESASVPEPAPESASDPAPNPALESASDPAPGPTSASTASKAATCFAIFDPNGGAGRPIAVEMRAGEYHALLGHEFDAFDKNGYELAGWNTEPDGVGAAYSIGEAVLITGHIILYAQWDISSAGIPAGSTTGSTTGIPAGSTTGSATGSI